ncbi:hypothetical protein [Actinomadura harenae]|uniref:Uncharacterized protein n=1 Tax=Actinomadura harenae TaxID=2483351 RepID=A0A3M2LTI8_9ACTN|nr:hypothetical protein [Actinomadura harenae]RMI39883.1 hypothetical protein EBO15_28360 [Actinomadura harenae]
MAIMRSIASFAAVIDGIQKVIPVGHLVEDDDELLVGRAHLFEPVEAHLARRAQPVEATVAAPGDRRTVSRPGRGTSSRGKSKTTGGQS